MSTTYDVRIWKIRPRYSQSARRERKVTSYGVQWAVAGKRFYKSFRNFAHADSYRSDLVSATRRGEAFDVGSGEPASWSRTTEMTWHDFVCSYVDMKWKGAAATYRRTIAEALTAVTPVMFKDAPGKPENRKLRSALVGWLFNPPKREQGGKPAEVETTLRWVARNTLPLSAVMRPDITRGLHDAAVTKLDGRPLARSVARQRRMVLLNALNYAVEQDLLPSNPVREVKWTAPKPSRAIDRRRVPNPVQVRTVLRLVAYIERSGPQLAACFAAMYFAALRPEEAVDLREHHLHLPEPTWDPGRGQWRHPWGELHLAHAAPHAGSAWTDSGSPRDRKALKHRERGEGRSVPCPPELTRTLREHREKYGVDEEGRLFRGVRGGEVPKITWHRVWKAARAAAFTEAVAASPLAERPYDLRHAAVSTWLNAGVPAPKVAEWAGHSVEVLLQVYAKCLDGQDDLAKRQVQAALGGW